MVHVFPGLWMTIALTLLSASLTLSSPVLLQDDPVLHMKSNQHQVVTKGLYRGVDHIMSVI